MTDENINDTAKNGKEPAGDSIADNIVTLTKVTTPLLAKAVAHIMTTNFLQFPEIVISSEKKKSLAEEKTELMRELAKLDVDPETFDTLLTNELDRKLKVNFGITFLILTCIFTVASYAIVVLDAMYNWGVSEIAITALIIETPIQFIGLLYIIARNLFPQTRSKK